jgi:hypothetical protein
MLNVHNVELQYFIADSFIMPVYGFSLHNNNVFSFNKGFSPETVRPFPKAPPRKAQKGRKRRKSTILTDTPEKMALEEEKKRARSNKRKSVPNAKKTLHLSEPVQKLKPTGRPKKKKPIVDDDDDEEHDDLSNICLVCCEHFKNSRPGESWIQCTSCRRWAHEECTSGAKIYTCQNCDSDESD